MSNIFEIFNPSDRHWKEQRDFDKVHVFTTKKGGRGPMQVDLDDKTIVLPTNRKADPQADKPIKRGSTRAGDTKDSDQGDPATKAADAGETSAKPGGKKSTTPPKRTRRKA